jgi:hypothetical protein
MDSQQIINLIKESFESWYNKVYSAKVSIVIHYNDMQNLSIKAYHTITMEVHAISIEDGKATDKCLIKWKENYNHGIITEEEAKIGITKKILMEMFSYQTSML